MIQRINNLTVTLVSEASSAVAGPTSASDGAATPTDGALQFTRYALTFAGSDPCILQAPIQVHSWDGTRWYSAGVLNSGQAIDASVGMDILIRWSGGSRMAVSFPGLTGSGAEVTVKAIPLEEHI